MRAESRKCRDMVEGKKIPNLSLEDETRDFAPLPQALGPASCQKLLELFQTEEATFSRWLARYM